ncbi:TetR/AcrR family transcriptional regulator [Oscillibacter sp.]|uniref:TetR/AcrR family transcriptional regulator n=1 Tax=Oscillibacter sp. TaxID=1945593 RepID=UPI0026309547|nr:TetR/AcrR family transcriptional regulator [Oscillibacter sp.]MDD3346559.1 TetR/AcrR family transcriptional regulator [Oscillibacter sp.]
MCKETFLRLPEEKRERFLDAAWAEFTEVKFAEVSINQIVRRAGVPRGSFYQYFADKADLFGYLLGAVRDRFTENYREILKACGGNLFETQIRCFDVFSKREREATEPMLERCIQIMRINPGMDVRKLMPHMPASVLLEKVQTELDLTAFRRRDPEFIWQVFNLTLLALGSSLMDSLVCPEREAEYRQRLLSHLEIIQHGALDAAD